MTNAIDTDNTRRARWSAGPDIRHEAAYHAAIQERIKANALTGRRARWFKEDESRVELVAKIEAARARSGFLDKMYEALMEWGSLTVGQERACRKTFAEADTRKAAYVAANGGSEHVGEIGKRMVLTVTVTFVRHVQKEEGYDFFVTSMKDDAGNVIVHLGDKALGEKDEKLSGKATPKAHTVRDGVKETQISRPKLTA